MKRLVLYPSKGTHQKTAALGGAHVVIGAGLAGGLPGGITLVPVLIGAAGVAMIAATAWRYCNPTPCFEADALGFTILGGEMRDWSQFQGAEARRSRAAFRAAPQSVVIKTDEAVRKGQLAIRFTHLSGPAADMAFEIQAYATHAQRKICLIEALAQLPVEDDAGGNRTPDFQDDGRGKASAAFDVAVVPPLRSTGVLHAVATLTGRVFGRREVI